MNPVGLHKLVWSEFQMHKKKEDEDKEEERKKESHLSYLGWGTVWDTEAVEGEQSGLWTRSHTQGNSHSALY